MSYSSCLKCGNAVAYYDKYCASCQRIFGLPDLPDWEKTNFPDRKDWAIEQVKADLARVNGKQ